MEEGEEDELGGGGGKRIIDYQLCQCRIGRVTYIEYRNMTSSIFGVTREPQSSEPLNYAFLLYIFVRYFSDLAACSFAGI